MLGPVLAVLVRNYRLLPGQGERRRIRLVFWSHALAFLPAVSVAIIAGDAPEPWGGDAWQPGAAPADARRQPAVHRVTDLARLRHRQAPCARVQGVRPARHPVQMLAQNVLRAGGSAAGRAHRLRGRLANPNRTVGEIFAGSARLQVQW